MPKTKRAVKKTVKKAKAKPKAKPKEKSAPELQPFEPHPIRFKEIFKKKLWGGPELSKVMKKKCTGNVGESWEVSELEGDVSVVAEGPYKNKTLSDLLKDYRKEIMGNENYMRFHNEFPLLVKFLCAHDRLSLQVHPTDDFAHRYEVAGKGKMEAWYILHAPKEGRVIRGVLPGTTIAEFRDHLAAGTVEQCLNVMEVQRGDVIFIPPGTIHTAFGGVVMLEVQQNSDTTYRMTDWGRKDSNGKARKLDVEKAMNVTDFYSMGVSKFKPFRIPEYKYKRSLLIKCEKFTMESIEIGGKNVKETTDFNKFEIMTVVNGNAKLSYGEKLKQSQTMKMGETYLIPAYLGAYELSGKAGTEIVVTYVG